MVLLVLITAVASALLDNVTTVLLIAPVTLLVCERLDINPVPFLIAEVLRLQHRRRRHAGRRPAEHHHRQPGGPVVQRLSDPHGASWRSSRWSPSSRAAAAVPRRFAVHPDRVAERDVAERTRGDPRYPAAGQVRRRAVRWSSPRFIGQSGHPHRTLSRRAARCRRAGPDLRVDRIDYLASVEWETLLFFAGLFILVGALVKTGVIAESGAAGSRRDRRGPAVGDDADSRGLRGAFGHHRQHPVCRHDDPCGRGPGRDHPRSRSCAGHVVGAGDWSGFRRQPDRRWRQRQCRDARDRRPRGLSDRVLGVHPKRRGDDGADDRRGRPVPVVALLRFRL